MSELSEEEIIKYIKDEIEVETDALHWFDENSNNATRKQIEESILAHQGILDLYNKEKEKREIAEENHKVLSLDLGQALKDLGLPEDTIIADELVLEINKNYISKDKIKELIENELIDISGFRCIAKSDLEKVLED